jgi:mono/diheme cytochrome c family protein
VITAFDDHFKYGRMWETPGVRPHEAPIPVMTSGIVPFSGGDVIYAAMRAEDLQAPLDLMGSKNIELGKKAYFTYCAQCHGKDHDGNGTVGQSFSPLPADLKTSKVQEQIEGRLFKGISFGIPNGRQPPLATTIDATERWRIVAYVKSLGLRQENP